MSTEIPEELKYTKTHEWVHVEGNEATIGITFHAQHLLGDLVFVELPEIGETYHAGDELAVVESVKAASDVFAPISGEVVEVNHNIEDSPGLINSDPYTDAWLVKLKIDDDNELNDLLSADEYTELAEEEE